MATKNQKADNVLVVGAGIGGIKTALELAEMGFKVYLQDKAAMIGGTFLQLDKQFPTDDCGMCKILPANSGDLSSECCVRRGLEHYNITTITNSNIAKLEGSVGDFKVTVTTNPELVSQKKCIDCRKCIEVCPVEVASEFNEGLATRKAIYLSCPVASLGRYIIDPDNCTRCKECVKVCPTNAIELGATEVNDVLQVGAVVLAPGFELFDARIKKEYGYSEYPNVVTSLEFERIFSGAGPYSGQREVVRPSDKKVPQNIGFIQCVGSRDQAIGRNYCSSACCMITLKEALMVKERHPKTEVNVYFMDMRAFGKGYHRYYERAKLLGINFIRNRPASVEEIDGSRNLEIEYVTETGEPKQDELELVVLAVGLGPPTRSSEFGKLLDIELDEFGFGKPRDFSKLETSRDGIFVCGGFSGPKDIPDTITEAIAAAAKIAEVLGRPAFEPVIETPEVQAQEPEEAEAGDEDKIGVFICDCAGEIGGVLELDEIIEAVKRLPNVAAAEKMDFLCINPGSLKAKLAGTGITKVVLGACAAYNYGTTFNRIFLEAGLNPALLECVNLREQLAWSHKDDPARATARAKVQLAIAVERLRHQEDLEVGTVSLNSGVLVVGGGIAGLTAALTAAKAGMKVELVEKERELGGNLRNIYQTLDGKNVQDLLVSTISEIEKNDNIKLHLNTELSQLRGYFGNFRSTLVSGDDAQDVEHGALILATGAKEYEPTEYLYGKDDRIMTQLELEEMLSQGSGVRSRGSEKTVKGQTNVDSNPDLRNVVMIQCVGSRNAEHPYCSRVCCSKALKNALNLKAQNPAVKIYILYQDIMSYGLMEKYYTMALEKGIEFVRYELEEPPEVRLDKKGKNINVRIKDVLMGQYITLNPDIVVLSTGIVPDNKFIAEELVGLPLTQDGFFEEANVKFRPVDFLNDGIYVCGLAHSPRLIEESMAQAAAAAGRALAGLARPEAYARRKVSEVIDRFCAGCETCVSACPYNARIMDPDEKIAVVLETLCQGCGTCVSVCPSGAAKLRGYKELQILNMIDAALDD